MFTTLFYQPLLNLAIFLYGTIGMGDLGIAITAMTLLVRVALAPLSLKSGRSQREMAKLGPKIEALREQHKGDSAGQSAAIMALYKEHGVNPLAGCLPLLIQMPILFGLYRVFHTLFDAESLNLLYTFVQRPEQLNHIAFGFLDISVPSHFLAILAAVTQFLQARLALKGQPAQSAQSSALNTQMLYFLPVMIGVIGWNLPAGLSLYWVVTTLFSVGEQLYLRRS